MILYIFLVLRLGRCLDSLYSALKTMNYPDVMVRITLTMGKIANALYLLTDHIIWIGRVGIMRVDLEKWNKIANKYWLMTIVMNLIRDVYEFVRILEGRYFLSRITNYNTAKHQLLSVLKDNKDVVMDTVKNGCDLFIPLTALGITNCTPGTIGMLGVISSLIGLYTIIDPFYKLSPS